MCSLLSRVTPFRIYYTICTGLSVQILGVNMVYTMSLLILPAIGLKEKYSRLSLSRTSRDLIKMFELSVVRDNQIVTS